MAKVKIFKKDGTPTPYFWSDRDNPDKTNLTVFKKAADGIKRMTGVHFDANKNKFVKE